MNAKGTELLDWDVVEYLRTPEDREAYMKEALASDDPIHIVACKYDVRRAEIRWGSEV